MSFEEICYFLRENYSNLCTILPTIGRDYIIDLIEKIIGALEEAMKAPDDTELKVDSDLSGEVNNILNLILISCATTNPNERELDFLQKFFLLLINFSDAYRCNYWQFNSLELLILPDEELMNTPASYKELYCLSSFLSEYLSRHLPKKDVVNNMSRKYEKELEEAASYIK